MDQSIEQTTANLAQKDLAKLSSLNITATKDLLTSISHQFEVIDGIIHI